VSRATVAVEGVEPVFVEQMILGAMAMRYMKCADLDHDDAIASARATWEADELWDEGPRTFEQAVQMVDDDLQHWEAD
jgi:hypothetical protein